MSSPSPLVSLGGVRIDTNSFITVTNGSVWLLQFDKHAVCVCVCVCWMLLSNQIFDLKYIMAGGGSGCGIGFLGVISNKLVTFPRRNSIRPSGSCCSVWGMQLLCVCVRAYVRTCVCAYGVYKWIHVVYKCPCRYV